jgi:hypothetical protein
MAGKARRQYSPDEKLRIIEEARAPGGVQGTGAAVSTGAHSVRTYHPESNGLVERFHRSTREELESADLANLSVVREIITWWVESYNNVRLNAGLGYLRPVDYFSGDPARRRAVRAEKLERAREAR